MSENEIEQAHTDAICEDVARTLDELDRKYGTPRGDVGAMADELRGALVDRASRPRPQLNLEAFARVQREEGMRQALRAAAVYGGEPADIARVVARRLGVEL